MTGGVSASGKTVRLRLSWSFARILGLFGFETEFLQSGERLGGRLRWLGSHGHRRGRRRVGLGGKRHVDSEGARADVVDDWLAVLTEPPTGWKPVGSIVGCKPD